MSSFPDPQSYDDRVNRLRNLAARVEAVMEPSRSERSTRPTRGLPDRVTGDTLALQRLAERRDRSPWSTRRSGTRSPTTGNVWDRQREDALENARFWRAEYFLRSRERDAARAERDEAREQRDAAWGQLNTVNEALQDLQDLRDDIQLLRARFSRPRGNARATGNAGAAVGVDAEPSRTRVSRSATVTPAASSDEGEEFPETG